MDTTKNTTNDTVEILCGKCNKPKGDKSAGFCKCGRPSFYSVEKLAKAEEYLKSCVDVPMEDGKGLKVKIPTRGGLAVFLEVSRKALDDWAIVYSEFGDFMERLKATQEEKLINSGLSGAYNPTISKVLLTKHGYREGIDSTTNDKDLPTPILGMVAPEKKGDKKS